MDPTKPQSDSAYDVQSLEGSDTQPGKGGPQPNLATPGGQNSGATDASGGGEPPRKKTNILKKLWQRFNIYLLLLILTIVIAIAVVVILGLKSRNEPAANNISAQNLSASALEQLANSSVTIGNASEVLNVQSSAVFSGTVLVRNNLEVAGTLQISGNLTLPGITVSGLSSFSQIQAQSLTITGQSTIQGLLTAKDGLDVTGDATITGDVTAAQISTGALQLNGNLVVTHHITAGGPIPGLVQGSALGAGGTASVSGSDTSGSITINTGGSPSAGCFATLNFSSAFSNTPHVVVTPIGSGAAGLSYYVNRTTNNMSVCTASPPPAGQTFGFDYLIFD
jgi:cytoskeletal protein CcmA (bactofilin family)